MPLVGSVTNTIGWVARYDAAVAGRSFLRRVAADNGVPLVGLVTNTIGWVARYDAAVFDRGFYFLMIHRRGGVFNPPLLVCECENLSFLSLRGGHKRSARRGNLLVQFIEMHSSMEMLYREIAPQAYFFASLRAPRPFGPHNDSTLESFSVNNLLLLFLLDCNQHAAPTTCPSGIC